MIHALKTLPEFFEASLHMIKNFEVRRNDRDFKVGDYVALNEWVSSAADTGHYTGRCILQQIVYVLRDKEYCKDGFVILGLRPCSVVHVDNTCCIDNDLLDSLSSVYTEINTEI